MQQRWHWFLAIPLGIIFVGLLVFAFSSNANAKTDKHIFVPRPLVGVSLAEVGKAAVAYTHARFRVVSGEPQILLTRSVTARELPTLGLSTINFAGAEPPLTLVVLKGDFDVKALGRTLTLPEWRVNYIAYVFDLKAGMPTLTEVSRTGGRFRTVLNDPSLPEEKFDSVRQPDVGSQIAPPQFAPTPENKLPYGATPPQTAPRQDNPAVEP